MFRSRIFSCGGFTLIEMIMSMVIVAVLATIGATMLGKGFESFFLGRETNRNDWQGRLVFERMTRELRTVRTPADIATMTAGQIIFTDDDNNQINYTTSGTTVTRAQNGGTAQVLADNIASGSFQISYLKDDGTTTAAVAADVYYITVRLTVSTTNATASYRSTVKPTNF